MTAFAKMQALYRAEINFMIHCFWDAGWGFALGDNMNGFKDEDFGYNSLHDCVNQLWEAAQEHYPEAFK